MVCGLTAGGNRIRTISPALVKGLSTVADERCRTDKLDGVIKHRSSRETTMVGRGASLDGRLFLGGTDGSNPVPSSDEQKLATSSGARPPSRAAARRKRKLIRRQTKVQTVGPLARNRGFESISLQRRVHVSAIFALPRREAGFSRGSPADCSAVTMRATSQPLPLGGRGAPRKTSQ
jgi:hypothetical protein